jgi:hypothetical protein
MYLGALQALSQSNNPERLPHVAHSMRELLEKLPLYYEGAPTRAWGTVASDHLGNIAQGLQEAQNGSKSYDSATDKWDGVIDSPLAKFLRTIVKALSAQTAKLTKKDVNRQFLRKLDPLGQPLPTDREEQLLQNWKEYDKFFQDVAHHRLYPDETEFGRIMSLCTQLLLDQLRTRTFVTFDALDKIIAEAE